MKKKMIQSILAAIFTAVILTGCTNKQIEAIDPMDQTPSGSSKRARGNNQYKGSYYRMDTKDADSYNGYLKDTQIIGTLLQDTEVVTQEYLLMQNIMNSRMKTACLCVGRYPDQRYAVGLSDHHYERRHVRTAEHKYQKRARNRL